MGKRVRFDEDARQSLWRGIDQLASAVRITLGPRGRSVVLDRAQGHLPTITRDGIAVAQELELPDPFENMGVHMLREVAQRTGAEAGDGTTTATVIAHRIVGDGFAAVRAGGNPVAVRRGVETAVAAALQELARLARPVEDERDLAHVATLTSGDAEVGDAIARAIAEVGPDGVVTVEEGSGHGLVLEVVDGLRLPSGYASPYFVNDAEDMEVALDRPLVLVVDGVLTRPAEIVPALEIAARQNRPLLCVCEDLSTDALAVLVVNRLRGTAPGLAVRMPGTPAERRAWLEDLALVTGATLLGYGTGLSPAAVTPAHLGRAVRACANAEVTTVTGGGGRTEQVRAALADCDDDRRARLAGRVAVLRVGGPAGPEREARRAQVEDALGATQAALEEGLVPGGGAGLLRLVDAISALDVRPLDRPGRDAVAAALAAPAWWIAANAGADAASVLQRVRAGGEWTGFDALSGGLVELDRAGIVDPAKVVRCALLHAGSLASVVLTTDALVVDDGEKPAA
jgi:chaperonin GroEL